MFGFVDFIFSMSQGFFAGFYVFCCRFCLKGPEGDKTVAMAFAAPDRFVLKPQREGGGMMIEKKIYIESHCAEKSHTTTNLSLKFQSLVDQISNEGSQQV